MAQTTTIATASLTAGAAAMGGPISQVFSELALMTAIMGAGGGLTLGLATKGTPWRDVARGVALGALLAGGFGVIAPWVVSKWMQIPIDTANPNPSIFGACSFVIGLAQDFILDKMTRVKDQGNDGD